MQLRRWVSQAWHGMSKEAVVFCYELFQKILLPSAKSHCKIKGQDGAWIQNRWGSTHAGIHHLDTDAERNCKQSSVQTDKGVYFTSTHPYIPAVAVKHTQKCFVSSAVLWSRSTLREGFLTAGEQYTSRENLRFAVQTLREWSRWPGHPSVTLGQDACNLLVFSLFSPRCIIAQIFQLVPCHFLGTPQYLFAAHYFFYQSNCTKYGKLVLVVHHSCHSSVNKFIAKYLRNKSWRP